jgi:hypothetical protein
MHSLRHSADSLLIEAGANPKQLQKMIGHSSIRITFDVYGRLIPDSLDGLAAALDAIDLPPEAEHSGAHGLRQSARWSPRHWRREGSDLSAQARPPIRTTLRPLESRSAAGMGSGN